MQCNARVKYEAFKKRAAASNKPGWSPASLNVTQAAVYKGEMERTKKKKSELRRSETIRPKKIRSASIIVWAKL